MPEISKRGIYYRLDQSPFTVKYGALTFYFSSPVYAKKFGENVQTEIDIYNYKIYTKTGIRSTAIYVPAFMFYRNIEKRGFYAELEWLGKKHEIRNADDLRIADIPEVIFHAAD